MLSLCVVISPNRDAACPIALGPACALSLICTPPHPKPLAESGLYPISIILSFYQCCINGLFSFLRITGTFSRTPFLFISSTSVHSSKIIYANSVIFIGIVVLLLPTQMKCSYFIISLPSFIYNIIPLDGSSTCMKNTSDLWLLLQSLHSI